jgi:hypothetical protein
MRETPPLIHVRWCRTAISVLKCGNVVAKMSMSSNEDKNYAIDDFLLSHFLQIAAYSGQVAGTTIVYMSSAGVSENYHMFDRENLQT